MLACSVSLRARRGTIAATVSESSAATDALSLGIIFATLTDNPGNALDILDAFSGQRMVEAASATATVNASLPTTASVIEATSPAAVQDAAIGASDAFFSSVKLLMGFEGANNSTGAPGMTDESSAVRGNATVMDGAKISTAQFKFGASSLLLDGSGDYVTFPDHADWDFGTAPFTIEGFFRFAANPLNCTLVAQWGNGWALYFEGGQLFFRSGGGVDTNRYTWAPTLNQWYHIAIDRDASSVARIYVDGVMQAKSTGWTHNLTGSTYVMAIGSLRAAGFTGYDLNGYVDEVRITKGVARYGSDSGYVVPIVAYPRS